MQRGWISVSKVAEEIRFDVSFREEFLIAAEAGLAGGKELLVHPGLIESGHRPAIEAEGARRHHHVGALQTGIPLGRRFHHLRIVLEELRHAGILRKELLSGASAGRRRSFDSCDRRNAKRAGSAFALVGAHFTKS